MYPSTLRNQKGMKIQGASMLCNINVLLFLLFVYCFLGLWNCVYLIQQFVCKAHRDVCLMRHRRMNLLLQ